MGQNVRIRRGLDVAIANPPRQLVGEVNPILSVALMGADYPGLRLKPLVEVGARVDTGDPVLADRRRPRIVIPSPVSGTVQALTRGPQRRVDAMQIAIEPNAAPTPSPISARSEDDVRELLLRAGLWTAFRTRPFGLVPDPAQVPDALFVTAMDTNPLSVDPRAAIKGMEIDFASGIEALTQITESSVFICQTPGPPLHETKSHRVHTVGFAGPHPAGLASTHIHALAPAEPNRVVWHIGWQEVVAIGRLLDGRKS
ncbi:MAG: NADH:ubiquinone reductase (Na(+)-transporting) subunit A, partial [Alphaproteobacteria bacterium]